MYRLVACISNFEFTAPNGAESNCGVEVWANGRQHVVLMRELPTNNGMSVTNASEHLAVLICDEFNVPKGPSTRFFEVYDTRVFEYTSLSVDEVEYTWKRGVASNPKWSHFGSRSDFKELLKNGNNS